MSAITYSAADGVGQIVISRPERRNALNHAALDALHDAVGRAARDELRALILSGSDDQFCSGADLKELEDLEFTNALRRMLDDLAGLTFPTIAAISGACMGLGAQLALACDLRIATTEARFAVPVAKLGLMVDHWTIQRLAMQVGHSTARWMVLTAAQVDASRAHEVGFVQDLVPDGDDTPGVRSLAAGTELAASIARLAPLSLAGSKLGLNLLERGDADTAGSYRAAFEAAWASDDLTEGRLAFTERRSPEFRGR
ncbi:MAG: enoyl-CoA hydratase-related protein [Actinomycetota bacterium]|nr:enoyl-CoA hydratase-related protein [Actinomycetota bacterium]